MPEEKVKYITTLKEIRVMNDPYRREIMTTMSLIDKPATAKEIADYMGEPPSKVNYHVGILHKYEFIDLHHTENINGIIAKFYLKSSAIFKIRIDSKNSKSKEISALRDVISSSFDMARDIFITQVAKSIECEDEKTSECSKTKYEEDLLYSKKVYMSKEELSELYNFVDRVAANKKGGRKLYSFFASYAEIRDTPQK